MVFDTSKLRGRIVEKFGSASAFAKHLGIANTTISAKLSGGLTITKHDIIDWCKALEIDKQDIGDYFFTLKV